MIPNMVHNTHRFPARNSPNLGVDNHLEVIENRSSLHMGTFPGTRFTPDTVRGMSRQRR